MIEKNKLFVGNLDGRVRRRHVKEFFSQFGEVVYTKVAFNKETRRSRGFGFVIFETDEAAQLALEKANGMEMFASDQDGATIEFSGREIRCMYAQARPSDVDRGSHIANETEVHNTQESHNHEEQTVSH